MHGPEMTNKKTIVSAEEQVLNKGKERNWNFSYTIQHQLTSYKNFNMKLWMN